MRWKRGASSRDVIDVRGAGGGRGGGRGMAVPVGGGLGLAGVIVVILLQVLGGGSGAAFNVPAGFDQQTQSPGGQAIPPGQDPDRDLRDFSVYVFDDTQATWEKTFKAQGQPYEHAKLVLYRDGVNTGGCGSATSAVGPFYCPADQRVYLDLSFYRDMQQQLGTSDEVSRLEHDDPSQRNEISVRTELQADCYAGVWARSVFEAGQLDPGDIDEAFRAAEAVGDDRLQRRAGRGVDPDSFTHGTSAQRRHWFDRGREAGEPAACDTFSADSV